jgi:serine phosphatase RsbU (regulator of sigma subunit)
MRALIIPLIVVVLVIPLRALTAWYTQTTLNHGAETQRLLRDLQYQRTRLGLLQVNQETAVRGYVITGDRRFLGPYRNADATWSGSVKTVRDELRTLHLPSDHLDQLEQFHNQWVAAVATPILANPHRDAVLVQRRGQPIMTAFRRRQVAFRKDTAAAADAEDRNVRQSITTALVISALVTIVLIAAALVLGFFQLRSAQEIVRIEALYQNEKRIADVLQEGFQQKHLPQARGVALQATYVPAASSARVGGDWYDAFELPTGQVLFSIGDVAGHGIEAAAVMTRARQAILAAALGENDPAVVLERANSTILLQEGVMVTAICGFIDPENFQITYATAGHPAPILAHPDQAPSTLPHDGVPLGIFPDSRYRTFIAQAAPGDVFVLYTDGVIEHERDAVLGIARLCEAASIAARSPNPALALYDAVFGQSAPNDDVAILTASFGRVA